MGPFGLVGDGVNMEMIDGLERTIPPSEWDAPVK
jgi:hypothetical protein